MLDIASRSPRGHAIAAACFIVIAVHDAAATAAPQAAEPAKSSKPATAPAAKPAAEAPDASAAQYALPGEDPPARFEPLHPLTVEDRRDVDVLKKYTEGRALEDHRDFAAAIKDYEAALKLDPDSAAILRRLVKLCFALTRERDAVAYGRRVLEVEPNDPETITRLLVHELNSNSTAGAEALLKSVIANPKLKPDTGGFLIAQYELGRLYELRLNSIEKAAAAFDKVMIALDQKAATKLSPRDQRRVLGGDEAAAYLNFGKVFEQAGRFDLAIRAFERGLVYRPDDVRLPLALAKILIDRGNAERALRIVEGYIKRQPQSFEPYDLLAAALKKLGREKEITARLERAAQLDAMNLSLQFALADHYRSIGQNEKAESIVKKLLEAAPTPERYAAFAASLLKRRKTEDLLKVITEASSKRGGLQAVSEHVRAIQNDPTYAAEVIDAGLKMLSSDPPKLDRQAMVILLYLANATNHIDKVAALQRLAIKQNPSPAAYRDLFDTLYRLKDYDQAATTLQQMIERYPEERNAKQLVIMGQVYLFAGKIDAGLLSVRESLRLDPNDLDALYILCVLLERAGKIDEALDVARNNLLKLDPNNTRALQFIGATLAQYGRNDEAITFYKSLLERFARNEEMTKTAHAGLSVVYTNMGLYRKGEAELEAVLAKTPDDAEINNDLGYLYADQGKNLERAEAMIRKAVAAEPDNYAYLDSLGWVLFKRGKLKDAAVPLEQALKLLTRPDATVPEHLGDVYFQLRDAAKAKAAWEKAVENASKAHPPDKRLPEIRKKLESLEKLSANPAGAKGVSP